MRCPRCVQRIHRGAESCPHCGFSLAEADARFGRDDVRVRTLTDAAGLFRKGEREQVQEAMGRISKRFPQLYVAVYTGSLGETAALRQFGFWLINRAAFEDLPASKPNAAGILLTIDPDSKSAGMVFGYLLDPFLDEADTFECLSRGHAYWLENRYVEGIARVFRHLEKVLKKRAAQARRDPEYFERKVMPAAMLGDMVCSIRDGHREAAKRTQEVSK